jgi:hypothetical protein
LIGSDLQFVVECSKVVKDLSCFVAVARLEFMHENILKAWQMWLGMHSLVLALAFQACTAWFPNAKTGECMFICIRLAYVTWDNVCFAV